MNPATVHPDHDREAGAAVLDLVCVTFHHPDAGSFCARAERPRPGPWEPFAAMGPPQDLGVTTLSYSAVIHDDPPLGQDCVLVSPLLTVDRYEVTVANLPQSLLSWLRAHLRRAPQRLVAPFALDCWMTSGSGQRWRVQVHECIHPELVPRHHRGRHPSTTDLNVTAVGNSDQQFVRISTVPDVDGVPQLPEPDVWDDARPPGRVCLVCLGTGTQVLPTGAAWPTPPPCSACGERPASVEA